MCVFLDVCMCGCVGACVCVSRRVHVHCIKNLVILTTVLVISIADMPGGDSYNIFAFHHE